MNPTTDKNRSTNLSSARSDTNIKTTAQMNDEAKSEIDAERNADPITGAAGAHPVGTSIGAIGVGAAAGAAGGLVAGPVGAVVGAVAGAVAGGYAGKATAEAIDPTIEDRFWSDRYSKATYADPRVGYDQFAPAYRYGWESFDSRGRNGETFESVEGDLSHGWNDARHESKLSWDNARPAIRDAWDRIKNGGNSRAASSRNVAHKISATDSTHRA